MRTEIYCAKCIGIDAARVIVEVDIASGIGIHLVGLADVAVKESLLRTITALRFLGYHIPGKKIVINLAPADMHKKGSGYDLPIALGIIAASEQAYMPLLKDFLIMGELGLDGSVRSIKGALPIVGLAEREGFKACILPEESAFSTVGFVDIDVYAVSTLTDVVDILSHPEDCDHLLAKNIMQREGLFYDSSLLVENQDIMDFSEIIGQENAKRGLEIAAAGAHNVIMIGAPGSGKSSLAKAMSAILPPMTREEALETNKIYSVAENMSNEVITQRPFRAPHYNISLPALLGGGSDVISPGEVSLAHNGVLFIDEFAEIPRGIAESLRGPLEDREVSISRMRVKVRFPASFMLVAATNPCPCGYYGEGDRCICTPSRRASYLTKLSGPLMERIDLHLWLHPVPPSALVTMRKSDPSWVVAKRVKAARDIQLERFRSEGIFTNSEMNSRQINKFCPLDKDSRDYITLIVDRMGLSVRACTRIIKIARTIADLEGCENIRLEHISEAVGYRFLDKKDFGL